MATLKKLFYVAMLMVLSLFAFSCKTQVSEPDYQDTFNNNIDILDVKDIKILLNETFESDANFVSGIFKGTGVRTQNKFAPVDTNSSRAPGVYPKDKNKNVYELKSNTYLEFSITVEVPAVVNFEYRSDMYNDNVMSVFVDGNEQPKKYGGYGKEWAFDTIKINEGTHSIKWNIPYQNVYSPNLKNIILLDNITVVPDGVAYIDIEPKGLQESYVDGYKLKFTAKALRADRSVIEDVNFKYSVNGFGNIDNNGVFSPTSEGDVTLKVSLDSKGKVKTAEKKDIKVHSKDYLSDPVTLGKYTFTGTKERGKSSSTTNINFYSPTPSLDKKNFDADGFFVIKGTTEVPFMIRVRGYNDKGVVDNSRQTTFFVRKIGDFYKRIWLRFGTGKHEVLITEVPELKSYDTQDSRYEGDPVIGGYSYAISGPATKSFIVNNISSISYEDAVYLMPSEVVQSDDFLISNTVHSLSASFSSNNKGDIIRTVHNWELFNHYYDMMSLNQPNRRKKQDAVSVMKYNMGVCEGYSNLYAALLRNIGIPTKVICSNALGHAWNQVLYTDGKWYLVDVTWDDPVPYDADESYCDLGDGRTNYTYLMTSKTDGKHTDPGIADIGRSLIIPNIIPSMTGYPDGWY